MCIQPLAPCPMHSQPLAPPPPHHNLPQNPAGTARAKPGAFFRLGPDDLNSAPRLRSEGRSPPARGRWPGSRTGAGRSPPGRRSEAGFCHGLLFSPFPRRRGGVSGGRGSPRSPGEEIQGIKKSAGRQRAGDTGRLLPSYGRDAAGPRGWGIKPGLILPAGSRGGRRLSGVTV